MSVKFKVPIEVDGQVSTSYIDLSTTTTHSAGVGEMVWNDTDGTVDIGLKGGNVKLQVGQEQLARVVNKTSPLITLLESNYQVVIITGATGQRLSVKLAQGNNDANSAGTLGMVTETIAGNQEGFITTSGVVREINTTGSLQGETWADGDLLFLSPTVAGAVTNIRPIAPNHTVNIGYVEYAHAIQGKIYVKVDNGYELGELHDVDTSESKTTPIDADNLLLQDSADLSVWKKLSWSNTKATLKTYFDTLYQSVLTNPITGTGTTNYVSKFTGTTSLGNSSIFDNGSAVGIFTSAPGFVTPGRGVLSLNGSSNSLMEFQAGGAFKSYLYQSGTNFEIYDTNAILFAVSGSERMRITSSGNVGIGTSLPASYSGYTSLCINNASNGGLLDLQNNGTSALRLSVDSTTQVSIYGATNVPMAFSTNATERMRITAGGNVGIGTSSPSEKLEVQNETSGAKIKVSNTGGGYASLECSSNATSVAQLSFTNQLSLIGGNVGIGTTSPTSVLHIAGGSYPAINIQGGATGGGGFRMLSGASGSDIYTELFGEYESANNGMMLFRTRASGTIAERMRITSSGNVGIGTTTPGAKLSILQDNGIICQYNTNSASASNLAIEIGAYSTSFPNSGTHIRAYVNHGAGINSDLAFEVNGQQEKMRITSSGNVGIGTTTPAEKLEVNGSIRLSDGNADGPQLKLASSGYSDWNLDNYNGSFRAYYGSNEYFRITDVGNVGIGTSSPAEKLQVSGSILCNRVYTPEVDSITPSLSLKVQGLTFMSLNNTGGMGNVLFNPYIGLDLSPTLTPMTLPYMSIFDIVMYPSPVYGMLVYNTDYQQIWAYTTGGWNPI